MAKIGTTTVGTVSASSYNCFVDAAFVHLDKPSSYVQSDKLSNIYTITGSKTCGIVGTTYSAHGINSGIVTGTVDDTNFWYPDQHGNIWGNLIRMKMSLVAGDSGAPLVSHYPYNERKVVGILEGGDTTYQNFVKFSDIESYLNVTIY